MAVLSKIRERTFLVIAIVGLALFAFIIGALIENGGFTKSSRNAGVINGKDIPFQEFRVKVDNVQKSQQGQNVSLIQASNSVWEQEIRNALIDEQTNKLGLRIGDDQLINIIKDSPQFKQDQRFLNAAGKFDINKFNEFVTSFKKGSPEQWNQWLQYEKDLIKSTLEQTYTNMIKAGFYTTQAEAKFNHILDSKKVTFDLVSVPYSTIEDKEVEPTDKELIAFMEKDKEKYKAEESREIEFVFIEDKASKEDEKYIKEKINKLLVTVNDDPNTPDVNETVLGFKDATNISAFVNSNSDKKYDSTFVAKKDLPLDHAEALFNLPNGEIYGPYLNDGYYSVSKSMGRKGNANVKASHILISYDGTSVTTKEKRTKEQAKAKAESLLAQLQANPASFLPLAFQYSEDTGSAQRGGDLGYFGEGAMVKPFNDFVFSNPVGKIGLVETDYGFHIINVTDKQDAIRLATIAQKITPSEKTNDSLYVQATNFETKVKDKKAFEATAKELKLTVSPVAKLLVLDEYVQGLGSHREIVRWAFESDVNDVKRFVVPKGNVIARLKTINEKGLLSIEEAKLRVGTIIKNEKKAALIKVKMAGATLEAVSKKTGSPVKEAKDVTISGSYIDTIGNEPKVVGTAFSLKPNQVSTTIDGVSGVFRIKVKATTNAEAKTDFKDIITRLDGQFKGSVQGRVYESLKKSADIEDQRANFY